MFREFQHAIVVRTQRKRNTVQLSNVLRHSQLWQRASISLRSLEFYWLHWLSEFNVWLFAHCRQSFDRISITHSPYYYYFMLFFPNTFLLSVVKTVINISPRWLFPVVCKPISTCFRKNTQVNVWLLRTFFLQLMVKKTWVCFRLVFLYIQQKCGPSPAKKTAFIIILKLWLLDFTRPMIFAKSVSLK